MNTNTSLNRSPLKFFILVFVLVLPFWPLGAFVKHLPIPINLPISALQFVCPMIAALILVSREKQPDGIKRLFLRAFDAKNIKHKIWYAPILLLNPLILVLSYGIMLLLQRPLPPPSIPFLLIPVFFVLFFLSGLCEYDPVIAAAITTVIAVIVTFLWGPKTLAHYRFSIGYKKKKSLHTTPGNNKIQWMLPFLPTSARIHHYVLH